MRWSSPKCPKVGEEGGKKEEAGGKMGEVGE
jgi:hypothetical protein